MFGIVKENKFVLIDEDKEKLIKTLAFMPQYSVDEIKEYKDEEIEIAYDGNSYIKGFSPLRPNEITKNLREEYYRKYSDKLVSRKIRKQALNEWTDEEEANFIVIIKNISNEVNEKYPYIEE